MFRRKRAAGQDASYTRPAKHTTAANLGKQYDHEFPPSEVANKSPNRANDGHVSSGDYVQDSPALQSSAVPRSLRVDFHHPLEDWLGRKPFRWLLGRLTRPDRNNRTALECIVTSYRNPNAPRWQRIKYAQLH